MGYLHGIRKQKKKGIKMDSFSMLLLDVEVKKMRKTLAEIESRLSKLEKGMELNAKPKKEIKKKLPPAQPFP